MSIPIQVKQCDCGEPAAFVKKGIFKTTYLCKKCNEKEVEMPRVNEPIEQKEEKVEEKEKTILVTENQLVNAKLDEILRILNELK